MLGSDQALLCRALAASLEALLNATACEEPSEDVLREIGRRGLAIHRDLGAELAELAGGEDPLS